MCKSKGFSANIKVRWYRPTNDRVIVIIIFFVDNYLLLLQNLIVNTSHDPIEPMLRRSHNRWTKLEWYAFPPLESPVGESSREPRRFRLDDPCPCWWVIHRPRLSLPTGSVNDRERNISKLRQIFSYGGHIVFEEKFRCFQINALLTRHFLCFDDIGNVLRFTCCQSFITDRLGFL